MNTLKSAQQLRQTVKLSWRGKRIPTLPLMSPLNHIRFIPGSRRPSRRMAARHASASVLVAFLMRSEANHAGAELITQCKTASPGLPDSQTQGTLIRDLQIQPAL